MTVIATDFVPVQPYPVDSVYLTVGQRLDVVIDANQDVGTYWLNVTFSGTGACGSSVNPHPAAIVQYEGAPWWRPGDVGVPPKDSHCEDDIGPVPVVQRGLPPGVLFSDSNLANTTLDVTLALNSTVSKVFWAVNNSSIEVDWDRPTLGGVIDGVSLPDSGNVIEIPERSQVCYSFCSPWRKKHNNNIPSISCQWSVWLIQNKAPIPHPVHLHVGLDYLSPSLLAQNPISCQPKTKTTKRATTSPSLPAPRRFRTLSRPATSPPLSTQPQTRFDCSRPRIRHP